MIIEWLYRVKSAGSMSRYLEVLLALKYFHIQVLIVLLNLSTTTAFPSLCVLYISTPFLSQVFLEPSIIKFCPLRRAKA